MHYERVFFIVVVVAAAVVVFVVVVVVVVFVFAVGFYTLLILCSAFSQYINQFRGNSVSRQRETEREREIVTIKNVNEECP